MRYQGRQCFTMDIVWFYFPNFDISAGWSPSKTESFGNNPEDE